MSDTAVLPIADKTRNFRESRSNWKAGEVVNNHLVISIMEIRCIDEYEPAAVGLREMTLSEKAAKQLAEVLAAPSRLKLQPQDLPSV